MKRKLFPIDTVCHLTVLYHKQERLANKADLARREKELEEQKKRHNITDDD